MKGNQERLEKEPIPSLGRRGSRTVQAEPEASWDYKVRQFLIIMRTGRKDTGAGPARWERWAWFLRGGGDSGFCGKRLKTGEFRQRVCGCLLFYAFNFSEVENPYNENSGAKPRLAPKESPRWPPRLPGFSATSLGPWPADGSRPGPDRPQRPGTSGCLCLSHFPHVTLRHSRVSGPPDHLHHDCLVSRTGTVFWNKACSAISTG